MYVDGITFVLNVTRNPHFPHFLYTTILPIPVAERSKKKVCGRSLAGIEGLNPAGGMDVFCECLLSGRGLCDRPIPRPHETYTVVRLTEFRRPRPTRAVELQKMNTLYN